jgi:hypothetical protein
MSSDPETMRFPREIRTSPQFRAEWFIASAINALFSSPDLLKNTVSSQKQKTVCTAPKRPGF